MINDNSESEKNQICLVIKNVGVAYSILKVNPIDKIRWKNHVCKYFSKNIFVQRTLTTL